MEICTPGEDACVPHVSRATDASQNEKQEGHITGTMRVGIRAGRKVDRNRENRCGYDILGGRRALSSRWRTR